MLALRARMSNQWENVKQKCRRFAQKWSEKSLIEGGTDTRGEKI